MKAFTWGGIAIVVVVLVGACEPDEPECRVDAACPDGEICLSARQRCGLPGDEGASCHRDRECRPGLVCNTGPGTPGTCLVPGGVGASCSTSEDCAADLLCNVLGDEALCLPAGDAGALCSGDPVDGDLHWDDANEGPFLCDAGLVCIDGHPDWSVSTCELPQVSGGTCREDPDCAAGLVCHRKDHEVGACGPPSVAGEGCVGDHDCAYGLVCNQGFNSPRCTEIGDAGRRCARSGECALGLGCNLGMNPSVCTVPGGEEAICGGPLDCKPHLACAITGASGGEVLSGTCEAPAGTGAPCGDDEDCFGDLVCHHGFDPPYCSRPTGDGSVCTRHEECGPGVICYANYSYNHGPYCRPQGIYGFPCDSDEDCSGVFYCSPSMIPHCISV